MYNSIIVLIKTIETSKCNYDFFIDDEKSMDFYLFPQMSYMLVPIFLLYEIDKLARRTAIANSYRFICLL